MNSYFPVCSPIVSYYLNILDNDSKLVRLVYQAGANVTCITAELLVLFVQLHHDLIETCALRLLALRGCEHVVFAGGNLQPPLQFRNV